MLFFKVGVPCPANPLEGGVDGKSSHLDNRKYQFSLTKTFVLGLGFLFMILKDNCALIGEICSIILDS
jgi:hypothetical protein